MKKIILSILFIGMIEPLLLAEGTPRINFIQEPKEPPGLILSKIPMILEECFKGRP